MDIVVKATCEVPAKVRHDVLERVEHATRFFDRLQGVEVVLRAEANPRISQPAGVEVTARTKGSRIRAEGWAADHSGAADLAVNRFERQLARYKARMVDRAQGRDGRAAPPPTVSATAPTGPRIVRTKTFALQPMLADEAAVQLELLGHEFFLFTDETTGSCAVVYRRRDGDLGLIQAEQPSARGR